MKKNGPHRKYCSPNSALTLLCIVFTMAIVEFLWDASNTEHLSRHKITRQEAEETVLLDSMESDIQQHPDEQRVLCLGRTANGRLLTIIYTMRGDAIRVVTGYPMTKRQHRIYFQGR